MWASLCISQVKRKRNHYDNLTTKVVPPPATSWHTFGYSTRFAVGWWVNQRSVWFRLEWFKLGRFGTINPSEVTLPNSRLPDISFLSVPWRRLTTTDASIKIANNIHFLWCNFESSGNVGLIYVTRQNIVHSYQGTFGIQRDLMHQVPKWTYKIVCNGNRTQHSEPTYGPAVSRFEEQPVGCWCHSLYQSRSLVASAQLNRSRCRVTLVRSAFIICKIFPWSCSKNSRLYRDESKLE